MTANRGSALLAFLTGLGVGTAVTALLAPRSGQATRRLIGRRVEDGKEWIKDTAATARGCVKEHGEDLRDRVKGAAGIS